ncbi:hypothetical protein BGZ94_005223, partial [Podila epigama]
MKLCYDMYDGKPYVKKEMNLTNLSKPRQGFLELAVDLAALAKSYDEGGIDEVEDELEDTLRVLRRVRSQKKWEVLALLQ